MSTRKALQLNQQYKEEATLLERVKDWLEPQQRDGVKTIRICDRYAIGYSDLFICAWGQFVVIELKSDVGTATPHQELFIEEMLAAGAIGGVCRTVNEVAAYIQQARVKQCRGQSMKE